MVGHKPVAVSPLSRAINIECALPTPSAAHGGADNKGDSTSYARGASTPSCAFEPYSARDRSASNSYAKLQTEAVASPVDTPERSSFFLHRKKLMVGAVAVLGVCGAIIGAVCYTTAKPSASALPPSSSPANFNVVSGPGPDLQCIGYSPFHHPQYETNVLAAIDHDFNQIKQNFQCIKTYYSQYFGNNVAELAHKYGLKVVLGVFYNSEFAATEIQHAIQACKMYPDTVLGIIVGSEDIIPAGSKTPADIMSVVTQLRNGGCKTTPIGTSQRLAEYLSDANPLNGLLDGQLDFFGITIYPFFSLGTDASNPADMLKKQLQTLWDKFPALKQKFHITETGWPTGGSSTFNNQPNSQIAETYFRQFSSLACNGFFGGWNSYYIYYDEKTPQALDVNQFFGLATADGTLKFSMPTICNGNAIQAPAPSSSLSTADASQLPPPPASMGNAVPTAEGWTIQGDCDFEGNDIIAVAGQGPQCPGLCNGTPQCTAFTWNRYNGGTCWLKSKTGQKTAYSGALCGVSAGSSSSPPASVWTYQENTDLCGNDLASVLGAESSCAAACEAKAGCNAFTWTDYLGGTCFLKAAAGSPVEKAGAFSGTRGGSGSSVNYNSNPQQPMGWNCDSDKDFYGYDIAHAKGKQNDCFTACSSIQGCNGFTWTNWQEGTCWFKNLPQSAHTTAYLGGSSCRTTEEQNDPATLPYPLQMGGWLVETGKDYYGMDIAHSTGAPLSCFSGCDNVAGCKAFTWTDWNGGTCWYKSQKANIRSTVRAYSATKLTVELY